MTKPSSSMKAKRFAESFAELQKIVDRFDRNELDLEEAIQEYERGLRLAQQLKTRLRELDNTVKKLKKKYENSER